MQLEKSHLFTSVESSEDDVTLYILDEKVAPLQQSFYFVNSGMSSDARHLWFYCAFPPSPGKTLGVVDFESDEIRHFPETQFSGASPYVDPETAVCYWGARDTLWRRGPGENDHTEAVNSLPEDLIGERTVHRFATHLTRSADDREFFIDANIGLKYVFGTLPVDGGDFCRWQRFDRNHNHAQFSPTDPDRVLFAEENHRDPITGLRFGIENRMWLIQRGQKAQPVFEEPTRVSHEWWDADGRHIWCVRGEEAWRTDIETRKVEKISWPSHCWHAYSSREANYIVADSNEKFYRGCPSTVGFLNRSTGQYLELVQNPEMKGMTGSEYHIDPHPRFCCNDRYVVFTTTIRGSVEVAIARTEDLIDRTC